MKRDMELVRKILFAVEGKGFDDGLDLQIDGYSDQEISYHIMILDEAGLLKGIEQSATSDLCWFVERLTWAGHEFLDAARSETIWKSARRQVVDKLTSASFPVLEQLLSTIALQELGIR